MAWEVPPISAAPLNHEKVPENADMPILQVRERDFPFPTLVEAGFIVKSE